MGAIHANVIPLVSLVLCQLQGFVTLIPSPEVIKLFSCSTHLSMSMIFEFLMNTFKIAKID